MKKYCVAVLLAAGSGSRMKSATAKQFMLLKEKPLIWYALNTIEESHVIDDCILVTGESDITYVKEEIIDKYSFKKVSAIVPGGSERWESVSNAMQWLKERGKNGGVAPDYIFVHDGARPFLTEKILEDTYADAVKYKACVAAVRAKDTVKIADEEGFAKETPSRKLVWQMQTPQVFEAGLIIDAYEKLRIQSEETGKDKVAVTDDASVVEIYTDYRVKLTESDYSNIKITTPEDLAIAGCFIQ